MNFRGIIGGLYMLYNHLDNWDIKRIKDNSADVDMLLNIIDNLLNTNIDDAYECGYDIGYTQGCIDTEEH